ncbi:hypothetical protein GGI21_006295, partial [Coemansia aciculifera]
QALYQMRLPARPLRRLARKRSSIRTSKVLFASCPPAKKTRKKSTLLPPRESQCGPVCLAAEACAWPAPHHQPTVWVWPAQSAR